MSTLTQTRDKKCIYYSLVVSHPPACGRVCVVRAHLTPGAGPLPDGRAYKKRVKAPGTLIPPGGVRSARTCFESIHTRVGAPGTGTAPGQCAVCRPAPKEWLAPVGSSTWCLGGVRLHLGHGLSLWDRIVVVHVFTCELVCELLAIHATCHVSADFS